MALTYTPQPNLGTACREFTLLGVDGKKYSLKDFSGSKALTIMFICNHCPYVKAIEDRLLILAQELQTQGARFVAICSNDAKSYPEDSFEQLKIRWKEKSYPFPYLHDETQEVAKKFGAVCTPDFFVYDQNLLLAYRGRLDDSWKEASLVKNQELRSAILALLHDRKPPYDQNPSMGCSIKWRS